MPPQPFLIHGAIQTQGLPTDVISRFYQDQCERANAIVAVGAGPAGTPVTQVPAVWRDLRPAPDLATSTAHASWPMAAQDLTSAPRNSAGRTMPNSGVRLQVHARVPAAIQADQARDSVCRYVS
jgi:hypothetical protein